MVDDRRNPDETGGVSRDVNLRERKSSIRFVNRKEYYYEY